MTHAHSHSDSRRPRWLCVAYAFPPINRSGTHRTLGFVKHLDRLGWDATVLTVTPGGEPVNESLMRDESLFNEVPASTTVVRAQWVNIVDRVKTLVASGSAKTGLTQRTADDPRRSLRPASNTTSQSRAREWLSRFLITPDSRIGWIVPAVRAGLSAIRARRPEVIYSTSPYMSAHLIALILSRWTRVPLVADFRDPWRGNPFRRLGFQSLDRWDSFLEWNVLRGAARIVCCTPTMTAQLRRRRPSIANKTATILNGFDHDCLSDIEPIRAAPRGGFLLTHCGQFYGPRSPNIWFEALRQALRAAPDLRGKLHIALIGSDGFDGRSLTSMAAAAGVGDCVHVLGQQPHSKTLAYMAGSDGLMLAGADGTGGELQIPNKLFEYLACRKPIIATCSGLSPIATVLKEARAEAIICAPDDVQGLSRAIRELAVRRKVDVADAWSGVDKFDRAHRAEELVEIFQRVSRRRQQAGLPPVGWLASPLRGRVLKSATLPTRSKLAETAVADEGAITAHDDVWSAKAPRKFE